MLKRTLVIAGVVVAVFGAVAVTWGALSEDEVEVQETEEVGKGSFSGMIVDAVTGKPIPHAHMMVRGLGVKYSEEADKSGNFQLELPPGTYNILPDMPEYQRSGRNDEGRSIAIHEGTHFINAKLSWMPVARLTGRVLDGSRALSAQILVDYVKDASGAENFTFSSLQTNEKGIFVLPDGYEGVCNLNISSTGYAPVTLYQVRMFAGETVDLGDVPMFTGTTLFGEVRDRDSGRPVARTYLEILSADGEVIRTSRGAFDGKFRLPAVELKEVVVRVSAPGFKTKEQTVAIKGNLEQSLSLFMDRSKGVVLQVSNVTGRGEPETLVMITDVVQKEVVYKQTVPNGELVLENLEKGPYEIEAISPDGLTKVQVRVLSGGKAKITLKPWAQLTGKILGLDGSIAHNAMYRYDKRDEKGNWVPEEEWKHAKDGEFELTELQAGVYRFEVKEKDSEVTQSGDIFLRLGDIEKLELQIRNGGKLTGHVVDDTGNPIANARVKIVEDGRNATTDENGHFEFANVINESLTIEVAAMHRERKTFENISVPKNKTTEHEFKLGGIQRERRHGPPGGRPPGPPPWGHRNGGFDPNRMPPPPPGGFDPDRMPSPPPGGFDPDRMPPHGGFDSDNMPPNNEE